MRTIAANVEESIKKSAIERLGTLRPVKGGKKMQGGIVQSINRKGETGPIADRLFDPAGGSNPGNGKSRASR